MLPPACSRTNHPAKAACHSTNKMSKMKSKSRTESSSSSNNANEIFDVIARLESADERALKVRRTQSAQSIAQSCAARSQVDVFAHLMECRILLQKSLSNSLLPLASTAIQTEDKNRDLLEKTQSSCNQLLQQLLQVRSEMIRPSIDDADDDGDDNNDSSHPHSSSLDKRLEREYETLQNQWKDVLNQNYSDMQISSGLAVKAGSKFKVVDQTFWDQVQSTLSHDRFLHSTSSHSPVHEDTLLHPGVGAGKSTHLFGFDDSKTYQHLLQDFISSRVDHQQGSSGVVDAAAERLRRSMKKKSRGNVSAADIDRRASKGRKIRYVTHEKLVNFTYPTSRPVALMDEDVLFKSLFGGQVHTKK